MPQFMTDEEANTKICPFMSRPLALTDGRACFESITCAGSHCACWGWVDGERGQETSSWDDEVKTGKDEKPEGRGWIIVHTNTTTGNRSWVRPKVIGPRRGQCEAMSPNITVEAP